MANGVSAPPQVVFPVPGFSGPLAAHWGKNPYGSDIGAYSGSNINGMPVVSMTGGSVVAVLKENGSYTNGGNAVQISAPDGTQYYYAHMTNAPTVNVGDSVSVGQQLGTVDTTGNAHGGLPHLHIGIGPSIVPGEGAGGGVGSGPLPSGQSALQLLNALQNDSNTNNYRAGIPDTPAPAAPVGSGPPTIGQQPVSIPAIGGVSDWLQNIYNQASSVASQTGVDPAIIATIANTESGCCFKNTPNCPQGQGCAGFTLGIGVGAGQYGQGSLGTTANPNPQGGTQPSGFFVYANGAEASQAFANYIQHWLPDMAPYLNNAQAFFQHMIDVQSPYYTPGPGDPSKTTYYTGWLNFAKSITGGQSPSGLPSGGNISGNVPSPSGLAGQTNPPPGSQAGQTAPACNKVPLLTNWTPPGASSALSVTIPDLQCEVRNFLSQRWAAITHWWAQWQTDHVPQWSFFIIGFYLVGLGLIALLLMNQGQATKIATKIGMVAK